MEFFLSLYILLNTILTLCFYLKIYFIIINPWKGVYMAKEKEKNKDKSAFYYLKETYKYGKEKRIYLLCFC